MSDRKHKVSDKLYEAKKFNNFKEMLQNTKKEFGEEVAFKFKIGKPDVFKEMKYSEYIEEIEALGTSLISIGLKDKRIGIISENRYEWEEAYLAITCGTGTVVPLDRALPETEIISLIERSEMEAIFYSSKYDEIMKKVKTENIGKLQYFISMDNKNTEGEIYSQKELVNLGKGLLKNGAKSFTDAKVDSDVMTIMLFTSGTTSMSKAVALSQRNICSNVYDISTVFDVNKNDTLLSFLPLHHTFESTVGFLYPFSVGAKLAFCEGIRHIADNIKEYKISVMISVPILFENMYKKVMQAIEKKGKAKKLKFGMMLSNFLMKLGIDKRRKIFSEIHETLGGNVRLFVAGAAAFEPEVEKGFNSLGIETYQGYGLTETSPVIAAEHKKCIKVGSVGQIFPSLEAKIISPNEQGIGELAVKGPTVMLEYYENEEATKETIVDGWLLTGDLAYFDQDDYLFITGRKKNVIVLKNGKNVYPEEIESLLAKIPSVKESFVYGKADEEDENDLKICAKIVYDKEDVKENYMTEDENEIKEKIWEKVKEINKQMPTYKYIKEIIVTDQELIKTTTQKVKRFEEIKTINKR